MMLDQLHEFLSQDCFPSVSGHYGNTDIVQFLNNTSLFEKYLCTPYGMDVINTCQMYLRGLEPRICGERMVHECQDISTTYLARLKEYGLTEEDMRGIRVRRDTP